MAKSVADQLLKILNEEMSSHLSNIAIGSKELILERFDREEDVDGDDFKELKDSTRKERRSKGYGGAHPILKRTGNLRKSIKVIPSLGSKNVKIESAYYGSYLNDGRSDMEPRRILEFPKEWDVDGSERIKSFSKTHERTMKRLEDFTDVYRNAER